MEPIEKEKRYCPECGKEILGRAGKLFCSDACRNSFNNRKNKDSTNLIRNINNALRKNYRILSEFTSDGDLKVDKKTLLKKKFNFEVVTAVELAKTGNTYYFVYDKGYQELKNDIFLVFNK
jgi:predicted nucleic acid-binding Zn ribbon protein